MQTVSKAAPRIRIGWSWELVVGRFLSARRLLGRKKSQVHRFLLRLSLPIHLAPFPEASVPYTVLYLTILHYSLLGSFYIINIAVGLRILNLTG